MASCLMWEIHHRHQHNFQGTSLENCPISDIDKCLKEIAHDCPNNYWRPDGKNHTQKRQQVDGGGVGSYGVQTRVATAAVQERSIGIQHVARTCRGNGGWAWMQLHEEVINPDTSGRSVGIKAWIRSQGLEGRAWDASKVDPTRQQPSGSRKRPKQVDTRNRQWRGTSVW